MQIILFPQIEYEFFEGKALLFSYVFQQSSKHYG